MDTVACSHLLKGRDPSRILRKTLALMEHQVTKDDVSRHQQAIKEYLYTSSEGFLVHDLTNVMDLLDLVRINLNKEPSYEELLDKLLDLCSIPPVLTRSLELLEYEEDLQEYFSWLGYMIVWLIETKFPQKIISSIHTLLTREYSQRHYISLNIRKKTIHASRLSDVLAELLEFVEEDVYHDILKIVQLLMDGPKQTCELLLKKGVVSSIIVRMEPTWMIRFPSIKPALPLGKEEIRHTDTILYILTSLLAHGNAQIMRAPTKFILWSLQWAFRLFAMNPSTNVERNNVLAVLLLLMDIYPDLLLGNLTFAYDIAMLAMTRDIYFRSNWTSNVILTTSHEDHSCMSLLLMCISYFPNFLSGPKVIEECRVVMGLLKLIGHQQQIKWHALQECYLIRLSLNILLKIVPASTEEFIEDGGPSTVLQLLTHSRENPNTYSHDIIFRSVELLAQLSYKFKIIGDSVAFNGGVNCVLRLCEDVLESKFLQEYQQNLLAAGIFLLEKICNKSNALEVLPIIIKYMNRYVKPDDKDQLQIPKLIIMCLNFVWNQITCCEENSAAFVKMGGVYLILDIVKAGCFPVQLVALGTLIDLCEIVECIPYLITWRKHGQGIKSLLMQVFREENELLEVRTDENGILLDYLYPLVGMNQFYETYCMCLKHFGNAAIGDMFVSCRPKVYSLLQILDYKQNDTVEIANEFYRVYGEELSVKDQTTYVLADNYLALKLGEEWKEIEQDFKKMKLQPTILDERILKTMSELTDKWGRDIQAMQKDVLKKHQSKQHKKEQILYNTMRDSRLSDAWESLCEMKYIARCSERLFRITSNFNIQAQINRSLQVDQGHGQMHRTFPSNISVTCMQNQHIMIPNEVYEDINKTAKPIIVSPISSRMSVPDEDTKYLEGEYSPGEKIKCSSHISVDPSWKSISFLSGT